MIIDDIDPMIFYITFIFTLASHQTTIIIWPNVNCTMQIKRIKYETKVRNRFPPWN